MPGGAPVFLLSSNNLLSSPYLSFSYFGIMRFSTLVPFTLLASVIQAAVVVHYQYDTAIETVTPSAVYVTVTADADVDTVMDTVTSVTTIYTAKSTPTVTVSGSVITTVSSVTVAPVTQYTSYPTTAATGSSLDVSKYASSSVTLAANTATKEAVNSTIVAVVSAAKSTLSTSYVSSSGAAAASSSGFSSSSSISGASSADSSISNSASTSSGISSSSISGSSASPASSGVESSSSSTVETSSSSTVETSGITSLISSSTAVSSAGVYTTTYVSSVAGSGSGSGAASNYYSNGNIMSAIATDAPASVFSSASLDITMPTGVNNGGSAIHTNKFYANLFLGEQQEPVYCQPYSVWWSQDSDYYGFAISYVTPSQRVFGPTATLSTVEYYTNPIGLISAAFSAEEFSSSTMLLSTSNFDTFSVTATLSLSSGGSIDFPLALGMGLVTAKYNSLTPRIFSQLGFKTVTKGTGITTSSGSVDKYVAELFNGITWVIYVSRSSDDDFTLTVDNNYQITGSKSVDSMVIQIGVLADINSEATLDSAAGIYATGVTLDATVSDDVATYTLDYSTEGSSESGNMLLYALHHHVDSFTSDMSGSSTSFYMNSPTKGNMTGYLTNKFIMSETLHTSMQFMPWSSKSSYTGVSYDSDELTTIASALSSEMNQDISSMTDVSSTYTAGKIIDKFAYMLLVAKDILQDETSAKSLLSSLKTAFSTWTSNTQPIPLIYDTLFKGVTSSGAQDGGDPNTDYGSPYYNDHHFHYGYWVHAAAIIAYADSAYGGTWAADNKDWVNSLVRDVANPSSDDTYFPVFRMFDFYNGHSWAAGLFESGDGKNEESTSEDVNFAYGMKLWGKVINDTSMEARGDLMLSVLARSLDSYFLMKDDNSVQPSKIIGNKVTGISYENKVDHTTFFGTNEEYIQGIQMVPITPASGLTRSPEFVSEEWDEKLESIVGDLDSGWLGILRSNQALIDPDSAYTFFSQSDFSTAWLDNGASLTWYLALSAGLKGN